MTVEENWQSYLKLVVPKEAGSDQIEETRRAFHAGSWAMLQIMFRLGGDDVEEDLGARVLETLRLELEAFQARIVADL